MFSCTHEKKTRKWHMVSSMDLSRLSWGKHQEKLVVLLCFPSCPLGKWLPHFGIWISNTHFLKSSSKTKIKTLINVLVCLETHSFVTQQWRSRYSVGLLPFTESEHFWILNMGEKGHKWHHNAEWRREKRRGKGEKGEGMRSANEQLPE